MFKLFLVYVKEIYESHSKMKNMRQEANERKCKEVDVCRNKLKIVKREIHWFVLYNKTNVSVTQKIEVCFGIMKDLIQKKRR